jgi:hypothetical protein
MLVGQARQAKLMVAVAALREVAEFLAGQTLSVDVDTVNFAQHFPRYVTLRCLILHMAVLTMCSRKQFSRSDFSKTLRDLGLTPSAVRGVILLFRLLLLLTWLGQVLIAS